MTDKSLPRDLAQLADVTAGQVQVTLTDAARAIETLRVYTAKLASVIQALSPSAAEHVNRARVALEDAYATARVQGAAPPK